MKDVLASLRVVANPRDAVSFARIVNVPRRKIGDRTVQELERLARRSNISPFEAVRRLDEVESLGTAAGAAVGGLCPPIQGPAPHPPTPPRPRPARAGLRRSGHKRSPPPG